MTTADARAESADLSSRMDMVLRDLRALTKSYHKLRTELADFQSRVSFDRQELGSDNGEESRRQGRLLQWQEEVVTLPIPFENCN